MRVQEVETKFARFGRVKEVRIVRHPRSGESRGFGFVVMEQESSCHEVRHNPLQRQRTGGHAGTRPVTAGSLPPFSQLLKPNKRSDHQSPRDWVTQIRQPAKHTRHSRSVDAYSPLRTAEHGTINEGNHPIHMWYVCLRGFDIAPHDVCHLLPL